MRDTENREVLRGFFGAVWHGRHGNLLTGTEGGVLAAGNGGLSVIEARRIREVFRAVFKRLLKEASLQGALAEARAAAQYLEEVSVVDSSENATLVEIAQENVEGYCARRARNISR